MEEFFVVQKRPTTCGSHDEFYFRIVDTRTGEQLMNSFRDHNRAEVQCQRLNELIALQSEPPLQKQSTKSSS